jgi:hypothetical protein
MKTATIQTYPLFQAKGWASRVGYRGKWLFEATNLDKVGAMQQAEKFAKRNGFTNAKFYEENHWGEVVSYSVKLKV